MLRYFHTVRHLRPCQVYGRVFRLLGSPRVSLAPPAARRKPEGEWVPPARREPSMLGPARFRFLNEERKIEGQAAWNDPAAPKLWLYNLHYFDDLNARDARGRAVWHAALIRRWVAENPPAAGNGWEPYPTSRRIVNWIKWVLDGGALTDEAVHSLAVQARCLASRLETHLLGNHLFANAKALVFAGLFFEGKEADRWFAKGLEILRREVPEQILADGGHFERSPMYHSLILEDLLDLINLAQAYGGRLKALACVPLSEWDETAGRMLAWLAAMCHPDNEIALFNDAAVGIAPSPRELEAYARRLGLGPAASPHDGVTHLSESGYVRIEGPDAVIFLDVGPLGPDCLPGHGHADTLSFEVSLFGSRVIVDAGTSRYDECPQRLFERGTRAHNTVVVDDADSSEVWSSFRVARRAKPLGLRIAGSDGTTTVECAHDGYRRLPGGVVHRRRWIVGSGWLRVEDALEGRFRTAQARFLLHPSVAKASQDLVVPGSPADFGVWRLAGARPVRWRVEGGNGRFEPASYHPEFGMARETVRLVVPFDGPRGVFELRWG